VDIDTQAVEVTKLSLLLKVLEEESQENVSKQLKLFDERALPSLHQNIKCGNSLIGTDIYADMQVPLDDMETVKRINAFDWDRAFPEIMQRGGFDAVIGNPPYVRQESIKGQKEYFKINYSVYHGASDLYSYFIEKGISLLSPGGLFSYIVANKWMRSSYGKPLRTFLLTKQIEEIIDFGDLPVFKSATTYPCIIRVSNKDSSCEFSASRVDNLDFVRLDTYVRNHSHLINQKNLNDDGWSLVDKKTEVLLKKMVKSGYSLEEYLGGEIYRGVITGLDKAFIIDEKTRQKLINEDPSSNAIILPYLAGKDIKRYQPVSEGRYIIFTKRGIDIRQYPAIENYLKQFKPQLMPKPADWQGGEWHGRKPGPYQWYEIQDTVDYYPEFEKPKIIYVKFQIKPSFTFDEGVHYPNGAIFSIAKKDLYLLGILNSKIGWFLISNYCTKIQGGYQLIFQYLGKIPIRTINFSDPSDKARHDKMVALVERMLALHKKRAEVKIDHEKNLIEGQIEATDKQIDALVYELYGLTEEEIRIVEGAGK